MDGGLTNPLPVDLARNMGADFVIGVNVTPNLRVRMNESAKKRVAERKQPNIFQVLLQSIFITTYSLSQSALESADIGIEPELSSVNLADFNRTREAIAIGRKATEEIIPELKQKLSQL